MNYLVFIISVAVLLCLYFIGVRLAYDAGRDEAYLICRKIIRDVSDRFDDEMAQKESEIPYERLKDLMYNMMEDHWYGLFNGEKMPTSDIINWLFTVDFTEEEILELGWFSEEMIDKANEDNTHIPDKIDD
jgi:hypothetical protein